MSRMSARFVGRKIGMDADSVYRFWESMGLVFKDGFRGWDLTELGKKAGGRLSGGDYPVPTFDFETIIKMMDDFYEKTKK